MLRVCLLEEKVKAETAANKNMSYISATDNFNADISIIKVSGDYFIYIMYSM